MHVGIIIIVITTTIIKIIVINITINSSIIINHHKSLVCVLAALVLFRGKGVSGRSLTQEQRRTKPCKEGARRRLHKNSLFSLASDFPDRRGNAQVCITRT